METERSDTHFFSLPCSYSLNVWPILAQRACKETYWVRGGMKDRAQSSWEMLNSIFSMVERMWWFLGLLITLITMSHNITVTLKTVDLKGGKSLSPNWFQWATELLHSPLYYIESNSFLLLKSLEVWTSCYTKQPKATYLLMNQAMHLGQSVKLSNSNKQGHFACY